MFWLLLVIQAYCDLALPEYTSNIVNVGIQNAGIENITPIKIRRSEFDKILSDNNNRKYILSHYEYDKETDIYSLKNDVYLDDYLLVPMTSYILKMDEKTIENNYKDNVSLFKSSIINYLKNEYKETGLDTEKLEMNYIRCYD